MAKRPRVFLDTSALIAGLYSPTGAAGQLIIFHRLNLIKLVISETVIEEIRRSSFYQKSPFRVRFANLLLSSLEIFPQPTKAQINRAKQFISEKDTSILASAKSAHVSVLVTWDKEFLSRNVEQFLGCPVYLPGDYLQYLRENGLI